jgi:broad specificity phosphatase PhoE
VGTLGTSLTTSASPTVARKPASGLAFCEESGRLPAKGTLETANRAAFRLRGLTLVTETTILLLRHGQTTANVEGVFRGRLDLELDDTGRLQAEALAGAVAERGATAVYTSPMKRAMQTAEPIAQRLGVKPFVSEALIDVDFGEWEGKHHTKVAEEYPEIYATWAVRPADVTFPGGESLELVRERVVRGLDEIVHRYEGNTVALVTHRVPCRVLLCHILGLSLNSFWNIMQDTACLNAFHTSARGWVLQLMNDTCHLRHLGYARQDFA